MNGFLMSGCCCKSAPGEQCVFRDEFNLTPKIWEDFGANGIEGDGQFSHTGTTMIASQSGSLTLRIDQSSPFKFISVAAKLIDNLYSNPTASGVTIRRADSDSNISFVRVWDTPDKYELRDDTTVLNTITATGDTTVKLKLTGFESGDPIAAECYVGGSLVHTEPNVGFVLPAILNMGLMSDGGGEWEWAEVSPCPKCPPPEVTCGVDSPYAAPDGEIRVPFAWSLEAGGGSGEIDCNEASPYEPNFTNVDCANEIAGALVVSASNVAVCEPVTGSEPFGHLPRDCNAGSAITDLNTTIAIDKGLPYETLDTLNISTCHRWLSVTTNKRGLVFHETIGASIEGRMLGVGKHPWGFPEIIDATNLFPILQSSRCGVRPSNPTLFGLQAYPLWAVRLQVRDDSDGVGQMYRMVVGGCVGIHFAGPQEAGNCTSFAGYASDWQDMPTSGDLDLTNDSFQLDLVSAGGPCSWPGSITLGSGSGEISVTEYLKLFGCPLICEPLLPLDKDVLVFGVIGGEEYCGFMGAIRVIDSQFEWHGLINRIYDAAGETPTNDPCPPPLFSVALRCVDRDEGEPKGWAFFVEDDEVPIEFSNPEFFQGTASGMMSDGGCGTLAVALTTDAIELPVDPSDIPLAFLCPNDPAILCAVGLKVFHGFSPNEHEFCDALSWAGAANGYWTGLVGQGNELRLFTDGTAQLFDKFTGNPVSLRRNPINETCDPLAREYSLGAQQYHVSLTEIEAPCA